jgi:hypothetical protein
MFKVMKRLMLLGMLAGTLGSAAVGCGYAGIAVAQDGTVYIARNDWLLFGALRQMYICKPSGATLTCVEAGNP